MRLSKITRLTRSDEGATLTEFGLIAPVLCLMLIGSLEIGHRLYMQGVLEGAVQKAARDGTLEVASGNASTPRDALDDMVRGQLVHLHKAADIDFSRRFFRTFTEAAAQEAEEIIDDDGNLICDPGESFLDANHNDTWDADGGDDVARAGARDNVIYTVTVSYPNMFPLHRFIGGSDTTTLTASTVLANQPYGDQQTYDPPVPVEC